MMMVTCLCCHLFVFHVLLMLMIRVMLRVGLTGVHQAKIKSTVMGQPIHQAYIRGLSGQGSGPGLV